MSARRNALPFVPVLAVAAALVAGTAQAAPRSVPLCTLEERLPLDSRLLNRIRARTDYEDLLRYASDNCPELALFLADTATATIPAPEAQTGGDREGPRLFGFLRPTEAPVAAAQPGTAPSREPAAEALRPTSAADAPQADGETPGDTEGGLTGGDFIPETGSDAGGDQTGTGESNGDTRTGGDTGDNGTEGTEGGADTEDTGEETGTEPGTDAIPETSPGQIREKNNNGYGNGGEGEEGETETGNPSGRTGPSRA